MPSHFNYEILPGGLSEQDHQRIFDMADRGVKTGAIARALQKHPATVRWFMYRNGLAAPSTRHSMPIDKPDSRGRKGYSREEDAFITALRIQRYSLGEIADLATKRFGHPRSRHGIEVRLIMLATSDEPPLALAVDLLSQAP